MHIPQKNGLTACAVALGMLLSQPVWSQSVPSPAPASATAAPASSLAEGEVRRVDLAAGKVTIRHGEIRHLDMPPMTMVFTARDKSLLDALKAGDRIRFMAVHEGGAYVVTEIQSIR